MKKLISMMVLVPLLLASAAQAQWTSINPGAGGQVQDVVADPNINQRLILASDMEGIYESLDNGDSWHPKGDLHQNRVYAVGIPKQSGNQKMYVGTLFGLEVSNDGGNSFTLVGDTKRKSIGAIAIHPTNKNIVLAAIGWKDDYDDAGGGNRFYSMFGLSKGGPVQVFRSTDGGINWSLKSTANSYGDRNVFAITFDPSNGNRAYLASDAGVFKSTDGGNSWNKMATPSGSNGRAKGVSISPDGKVLYAVYQTNAAVNNGRDQGEEIEAAIFATRTSSTAWQNVTGSLANYSFWQPEVDPRSTGSNHKLIVSMDQERQGLYEGSINWNSSYNSASPGSVSWAQVWTGNDVTDGWDVGRPNTRFAHYTPDGNGWSKAIWSTQNQTIYRGAWNGSGYNWSNRYSYTTNQFFVDYWGIPVATYGSRGTESTYTWDIDADANYVIQGMGDNGPVESWDGGATWSNVWMRQNGFLSDVQAVEIADAWGKKVVIAQMAQGFGGNAGTGNLYVKHLDSYSPTDQWEMYAAGPSYRGALPNGLISDIAESPASPGKIFVFSRGAGVYMQDFGWAYHEHLEGREPWFEKISNGIADQISSVKKIAPHPTNPNIVYLSSVSGNTGVFKGEFANDTWSWSKIYNGGGWDAEVFAWDNNGQTVLFYSGKSYENGDGENFVGAISLDDGATWKTVLKSADTRALRSHSWYNTVTSSPNAYSFKFQNKGGLTGYDNRVIMSHYDHTLQKTYAVMEGVISGSTTQNASVSWSDITGDLPFGGLTTARVVKNGSVNFLYVSTAGAGAWRKQLGSQADVTPTGVAISGCPSTSMAVDQTQALSATVSPTNATNKSVSWSSSNPSVATVNSAGLVSAVAAGSATISVNTVSGGRTASCGVTVDPAENGGTLVTVRARMILGSSDTLQLRVNDNIEHTWTISGSSFADYTVSAPLNGNVKLYFPDNATDLEVDYLRVGGTTYQAEDQATNTAAWMNGSCGGGGYSQVMHCSGHIDFGSINTGGGSSGDVPVSGVAVSNCTNPTLAAGGTVDLDASVSPANASNTSVSWSSSNNNVASVNSNGLVTAVAPGSANITVTTADGGFASGCAVTVTGGSGQPTAYRYLMLYGYGTVQLDVTIQQLHWMVGSQSYPDPKLTWNTKSQVTSSTNGTNDYAAFDNSNVGWAVGSSFPAWIAIDLGAGNAISPDAVKLKPNADNRGFSSFEVFGSNDNSNWDSLYYKSGITSADYSQGLTTFEFSN